LIILQENASRALFFNTLQYIRTIYPDKIRARLPEPQVYLENAKVLNFTSRQQKMK